ncbi:ABC transporter substrate-binding protein [Rhizobium sp. CF142]|uniref:ABC transporter substrate-binding protein n=1 Tax=Rhizobium sp. CF142 TaxID=1144314 RepID=UPI00026EF5B4|nr:ABC transporter substrate-binding protein [Rhizobium sp. CF142]EJJ31450.1 ABC-type nitrate/sulfonate/bicarbonate transport system, periplasmic component [Rhizobium sp. CF142]
MQNFHISATGHSLNYLPEYVASWKGFFADERLSVSASVPSPWDLVLSDIASAKANAALGGIWVPSMFFARGKRLTPFAQVAARAPLAIVGREAPEDFDWARLAGKIVSMKGSNGASVGLFIKMLLRENGVDPLSVKFVQDLDGKMLSDLFLGGMGDYLVIDYPSAASLEMKGLARVVSPLAVTGGNVPWSVYYAPDDSDDDRLDLQTRFARALGRAMTWIIDNDATGFRGFLAETFPKFDADLLVQLANTYRSIGMWTSPKIDEAAYARWQRGIADGHLTEEPIAYSELIDRRPTSQFSSL